jgi:hypothetical protein
MTLEAIGMFMGDQQKDLNILEAIIYQSRTEEKYSFPKDRIQLYSEFLKALIVYRGGDINGFPAASFDSEELMYDYFQNKLQKTQGPISSQRLDLIHRLSNILRPRRVSDEKGYPTIFYDLHREICNELYGRYASKSFTLTESTLKYIEKEVLPRLSKTILPEIKDIGELLREYIEENLILDGRKRTTVKC